MARSETWAAVVGYEGYYEVSSLGRVRSISRTVTFVGRWGTHTERHLVGTELAAVLSGPCRSYKYVPLNKDGIRRSRPVHQLVCEAFHGPRPEGFQAAHINGVSTDCRAENLRWASRAVNYAERTKHGGDPAGARNGRSKLDQATVDRIRNANGTNREIASKFGISASHVSGIRRGIFWRQTR